MSKFKKKGSGELPKISTASLPDIVFMLLFFFMVATVLRDNTLLIQNTLPAADQVQKLDKKDRVIYIYMLVSPVPDIKTNMVINQEFNSMTSLQQ